MNAYKDRIAETERVKERKRARVERGAGDVPMKPGNRDDDHVAVRRADASGGDIRENQHEEKRMRDIHDGKKGYEAASEEQPDKLRKTLRFEQEASSASASSDPTVTPEYLASGETQSRRGSVLVQKSGRVDEDMRISAMDPFYGKDGRKSRYIGEVLEWYREEDAGDLKRSESNELVVNLTCPNAFEGGIWKSDQKVVMDEKINPKIVMDEELVQNDVMAEKLIQNNVMNAKIDPKVVMDLSIFKMGGWNSLQPINQKLFDEFIGENEPWLLNGIPSRDPSIVTQFL